MFYNGWCVFRGIREMNHRKWLRTSMFLLATFFTTAGNSSEAFLPLAIS